MKSKIEHDINDRRQHKTIVAATLVVARKRQQVMFGFFDRIPYADAVAIATPSIEAWEAYKIAKADAESDAA